jgi:hypothetical protein
MWLMACAMAAFCMLLYFGWYGLACFVAGLFMGFVLGVPAKPHSAH